MGVASKAKSGDVDEWMSIQAAMDALGLSRVNVLHLAVKGSLVAQTVAKRTVISRESVDAEIERRKQRAASDEPVAAL